MRGGCGDHVRSNAVHDLHQGAGLSLSWLRVVPGGAARLAVRHAAADRVCVPKSREESGHFVYTEEIAKGRRTDPLHRSETWMQAPGRTNYEQFGRWADEEGRMLRVP